MLFNERAVKHGDRRPPKAVDPGVDSLQGLERGQEIWAETGPRVRETELCPGGGVRSEPARVPHWDLLRTEPG